MSNNKKGNAGTSKGMKASFAFFIANVVTAGIAYITTPLFTRMLTSPEFGKVSLYLTWKQVFGIIAMFCLSYGVFNNGMSDYPEDRDRFSYSLLSLSNIITLVFAVAITALFPIWHQFLGIDYKYILLMVLIFFFQPAYTFWTVRQRYEFKFKKTVFFTIVLAIVSPLTALLCIRTFENKVDSRIFGAELPLVAVYICFYVYLGIKGEWKSNRKYWGEAFRFNLPLIPHYLSTYVLSSSDKIMISHICGTRDNAFYTVAYSVASVGTIVWSAANASLIPFTYEKCKKKEYKAISDITAPILLLYGVVCLIIILLAPEVVAFLSPAEYHGAIYAIPPVIAGIFFQVQYYLYANVIYYYKKPRYVMYASVSSAVLNLVLNYVFINKYGYLAAGYTTFICYLIQAVIDYFAMRKVVGQSIYNMKFIVLMSAMMVIICLGGAFLYTRTIIRFALLAGTVIIIICLRKKIISIFKRLKNF